MSRVAGERAGAGAVVALVFSVAVAGTDPCGAAEPSPGTTAERNRTGASYRDGWTPAGIEQAVAACTEELVEGAWRNTEQAQGVEAYRPLTPELRRQLAPQIEGFRTLCDCTVRETAKRYGKADYGRNGDAVERYAVELVERGTCKAPR